jgi:hypothetical protein
MVTRLLKVFYSNTFYNQVAYLSPDWAPLELAIAFTSDGNSGTWLRLVLRSGTAYNQVAVLPPVPSCRCLAAQGHCCSAPALLLASRAHCLLPAIRRSLLLPVPSRLGGEATPMAPRLRAGGAI